MSVFPFDETYYTERTEIALKISKKFFKNFLSYLNVKDGLKMVRYVAE